MPCAAPNGADAGDVRTVRPLVLEDHPDTAAPGPRRRTPFADVETTGFGPERDAVVVSQGPPPMGPGTERRHLTDSIRTRASARHAHQERHNAMKAIVEETLIHHRGSALAALLTVLTLAACGGSSTGDLTDGGGAGNGMREPTGPPTTQPPPDNTGAAASRRIELGNLDGSDAAHQPITGRGGTLRVGPPVRPRTGGAGTLRSFPPAQPRTGGGAASTTHRQARVRHFEIADATPAARIAQYLEMTTGFGPYNTLERWTDRNPNNPVERWTYPPFVSLAPNAQAELRPYVVRAVQILNTAIPPGHRMVVSASPGPTHENYFDAKPGEIPIAFDDLWPGVGGIAETGSVDARTTRAYIRINRDEVFDRIAQATTPQARRDAEDQLVHTIVHELLHALGAVDHPDKTAFPDSVLSHSLRWNPGDILFEIDRDVLVASYNVIRVVGTQSEIVEDLSAWNARSTHLVGEIESAGSPLAFGIRTRHGFHAPWFEGPRPATDLASSTALADTVRWEGRLLGFTPATEAVAGSASLEMNLASLTGELDFVGLEYWSGTTPGAIGTGTAWHETALSYQVAADGNRFVQTGGDDGVVTGVFVGTAHQGMGGTLERSDLTAAFGGTR